MDIKKVRSLFTNFVPDSWLQERLELGERSREWPHQCYFFHFICYITALHCPRNVLTTIITWGVVRTQPLTSWPKEDVEKLDQKNPIRPIKHTEIFLMWFYVLSRRAAQTKEWYFEATAFAFGIFLNENMHAPLGTKFHKSLKGFTLHVGWV